MTTFHPEFVVDELNQKKAVLIPFPEWVRILEELEDLEDIRAYDQIKETPSDAIPFEDAIREIESGASD